ncbi:LTA synthase family protein [Polaribacter cellanae]|uniref:Sulfatase-like hydrolase/transferase n=1 Tax=Polaribacter cellanae TaxID=2818493 RepID=A0A975CQ76_9FLAO|nr:alkaline phosphatase family protein [Polaribacter cellanae]QTE23643.1 sulfatase-like hydrolase/transferase [Polaribacter cellanae]
MKKNLFLKEFSNLLFFWFIGVFFFFVFRLTFILIYSSDIQNPLLISDYINSFFMGFRFDITAISYFLIIPFLCLYILLPFFKGRFTKNIRIIFQYLFIILSVIFSVVTINYYKEYKDQFNHFLFMGLYDDKKAVFESILSDFNPIFNSFIIITLIFIFLKIFTFYENSNKIYNFLNKFNFKYKNITYKILALVLFIGSIRGSYTKYPVRRFYAAVSPDNFINKTITNPFVSLNNAISDYNEINKSYDKNPFGEIPLSIQNNFSPINNLLKKETINNSILIEKPEQVFLVVMESYDSWPLMKKYRNLKLSSELTNIENKAISFKNFTPAASTTMNSFGTIVTSVPYCGINISKIGALRTFPTSIFEQFKKMGYETNFFYGGYLSWQNIDNFVRKQGAENVYGAANSKASKGIWGIDDEALYKMVLNKVNNTKKSLNVILTMSYHSPYEVDIYKKGFFYKKKSDLPLEFQKKYNEEQTPVKALGHLWYADKTLGEFVKKAEKKFKSSLFSFTGDHFGRKFINNKPTLYESSTVPFIIYGKNLKSNLVETKTAGSHKDIGATLYDLVSPANFKYYSFGNSLINSKKNIGYSYDKVNTRDEIISFTKTYGAKTYYINKPNSFKHTKNYYKKELDSVMSLAWHYTVKGDTIK